MRNANGNHVSLYKGYANSDPRPMEKNRSYGKYPRKSRDNKEVTILYNVPYRSTCRVFHSVVKEHKLPCLSSINFLLQFKDSSVKPHMAILSDSDEERFVKCRIAYYLQ